MDFVVSSPLEIDVDVDGFHVPTDDECPEGQECDEANDLLLDEAMQAALLGLRGTRGATRSPGARCAVVVCDDRPAPRTTRGCARLGC